MFDFNFENNRIIKTEILSKGTLRELLNHENDGFQISGQRNLQTFINGPDISKSLLDISGTFTLDETMRRKGHHRHSSNISSSSMTGDKSFLKPPIRNPTHVKSPQTNKIREIEAIKRDIRIVRNVPIPNKPSTLILKEGRIFFIGGYLVDKTVNSFIEYIEEFNTLYFHPPMNYQRQDHGVCFVNCRIYAIGGFHFGDHAWYNKIESINLPERPQIEYQNNYDMLSVYEPYVSNQDDISPRMHWKKHEARLKFGRSNISCASQLERYIYIF